MKHHALRFIIAASIAAAASLVSSCGGEEAGRHEAPGGDAGERAEALVSAAASLKEAFMEIAEATQSADTTVKITFNFGASNLLARQIREGAGVDLFASAAEEIMDSLQAGGYVVEGARETFAANSLVVVEGTGGSDSLAALTKETLKKFRRIAVAAPGVPARIYTEEALRAAGIWDEIGPRLVFGENVRQVLDYAARGEAEIGFVYASDAAAFGARVRVIHRVDSTLHRPIRYPAAIITGGKNARGARSFLKMLTGSIGRDILRRHGFTPIDIGKQPWEVGGKRKEE